MAGLRQATSEDIVVSNKSPKLRQGTEEDLSENFVGKTFGSLAKGMAESAVTIGTGIVGQTVGGLAGVGELAFDAAMGVKDPLGKAVKRTEDVSGALTYQPKSQESQKVLSDIAKPFEKLEEGATTAGNAVLKQTNSPALATITKMAIENVPGLLGLRLKSAKTKAEIAEIQSVADELGIDLGAPDDIKTTQIKESAENLTGGNTSLGESLPDVKNAVVEARQAAKDNVDRLYDEARSNKATVSTRSLEGLNKTLSESLKNFGIKRMKIVKDRLKEIESITNLPDGAAVKLNAIDDFRQSLVRDRPKVTDKQQGLVLDIIKRQLDDHLDNLFDSDMISGDVAAIQKWKDARSAHSEYIKTFSEDKVLNNLAKKEATPEEMRKWIFGASATGANKQSGLVVQKLKKILGEDSPEFIALRQDALMDLMEPLMKDTPDFKGFVKKYDSLILKNKTLADELFPDSAVPLKELRDIANASNSVTLAAKTPKDWGRLAAVVAFGHGIAKAAMKVSFATQAFNFLRKAKNADKRREIMGKILGYDALKPVITSGTLIPGAGETAKKQSKKLKKMLTPVF